MNNTEHRCCETCVNLNPSTDSSNDANMNNSHDNMHMHMGMRQTHADAVALHSTEINPCCMITVSVTSTRRALIMMIM
jgi:hypothetical protein